VVGLNALIKSVGGLATLLASLLSKVRTAVARVFPAVDAMTAKVRGNQLRTARCELSVSRWSCQSINAPHTHWIDGSDAATACSAALNGVQLTE
jgi:hypothetical protein